MDIDCHVHTSLCGHAKGEPIDYVFAAYQKGMRLICFTDHIPMSSSEFGGSLVRMRAGQLSKYRMMTSRARELGRQLGTAVLHGIEAEIFPEGKAIAEMDRLLDRERFDFIVGGLHHHLPAYQNWLSSRNIHSEEAIVENYFAHLKEGVQSKRYHSIAHFDLIKVYGTISSFNPLDYEASICDLLSTMFECGVCLEVNTKKLHQGEHLLFPDIQILEWAHEIGLRFTLGSDAHHPSHLGRNFQQVVGILRALGIKSVVAFRRGGMRSYKLPRIYSLDRTQSLSAV